MPRGPRPKEPSERVNPSMKPAHEWRQLDGSGWQHGVVPRAPAGVCGETRRAWRVWFGAWFAALWGPEDLPALVVLARVYDAVMAGDLSRCTELRAQMDAFAITPKGQQDRRLRRPDGSLPVRESSPPALASYGHLRAVVD